ncbi:MAG: aldehyde ferredoxin oxidoreductase C-terminal domain-containing protein [Thermincola sp.]|jgi:aldehyde:ferredoxin oxidoreductase|nr:aldehyde ferredoxin oxidoreductase C-terminal domain-containing protein [Thermincola sp.]MDT3703339.1 aldehyde ferredoxin oxidoreductase C-terminal domain-containing protein [Thermincola sp.]
MDGWMGTILRIDLTDGTVRKESLSEDFAKKYQFENMKSEYYTIRGWDVKTGVPTRETLEKYGMASVAADLEKRGVVPQTADAGKETINSQAANA